MSAEPLDSNALSTRRAIVAAYEHWASTYSATPHNPLMAAEQRAMLALWPELAGRRVLDLASGSGRYTRLCFQQGARDVVALDVCAAMLDQHVDAQRVRADMMKLPFASRVFDVVIAGLAVGHAHDLQQWTEEMARVLVSGGALLYSDFHPAAANVGFRRAFKDAAGREHCVPHFAHRIDAHRRALAAAGLTVEALKELRVGEQFREEFPGSQAFNERWAGLPLVLVVRARK